MRRGTIFVLLFVVVAGGIIAASQFLRSQPPLEITVAVDPLAEKWVQEAINSLNATNPLVNGATRIQIKLVTIDDLAVWTSDRAWTADNHPAAWIPAASLSARYASESGLPLEVVTPSLARTPLVWGGYASRLAVLDVPASGLDWEHVAAAAAAESWVNLGGSADWQFIKLAFAQPNRKISGLAVLLSGASAYHQAAALDNTMLRDTAFRDWMLPVIASVPSFSTLGADPALTMQQRGTSTAEIALLPEVQWLNSLNTSPGITDPIQFSYPAYQVMMDFPLVRWNDSLTTDTDRAAVAALQNWLLADAQQTRAVALGLRPVQGEPDTTAALFAAGMPYGIQMQPDYGQLVQPPSRSDVQGLIQWFGNNQ